MTADSFGSICSGGDQRVRNMPAEMVNGKPQTRLVYMKETECAPVPLSDTASSYDERELEKRLGLQIGEVRFPSEGCFVSRKRIINAAKREKRCGSMNHSVLIGLPHSGLPLSDQGQPA